LILGHKILPKIEEEKKRVIHKNYADDQIRSMEDLGFFDYIVKEPIPSINW
jgi:hypothetical protein